MATVVAFVVANAAAIGAGAAVVGAGVALEGNRRAKSAAKDLQQASQRQGAEQAKQRGVVNRRAAIVANRSKRERARRFRILSGSQRNEAANAGVSSSSGATGAAGSLAARFAGNEGIVNTKLAGDSAISASKEREALAVGQGTAAQIAGMKANALSSVGKSIFSIGGGFGGVTDLFAGVGKGGSGPVDTGGFS